MYLFLHFNEGLDKSELGNSGVQSSARQTGTVSAPQSQATTNCEREHVSSALLCWHTVNLDFDKKHSQMCRAVEGGGGKSLTSDH